eukprot:TRINITY_DN14660_c0_g1_i2.p2 TRINITY_DN14660_c0_g1~~TRINITY_DN14660_c0_g1_i2.p2  ORF type:complete len:467 (+),score=172.21 TRINITY_DN14660_c0_g1_i2:61-1461(+)
MIPPPPPPAQAGTTGGYGSMLPAPPPPALGDIASEVVSLPSDLYGAAIRKNNKYYGFLQGEKLSTRKKLLPRTLILSSTMLAVMETASRKIRRLVFLNQISGIHAVGPNCSCVAVLMRDPKEPAMLLRFPGRNKMSPRLFFNNLVYNARFAGRGYAIETRLTSAAEVSSYFPMRAKKPPGYLGPKAKIQLLKNKGGVEKLLPPRNMAREEQLMRELQEREARRLAGHQQNQEPQEVQPAEEEHVERGVPDPPVVPPVVYEEPPPPVPQPKEDPPLPPPVSYHYPSAQPRLMPKESLVQYTESRGVSDGEEEGVEEAQVVPAVLSRQNLEAEMEARRRGAEDAQQQQRKDSERRRRKKKRREMDRFWRDFVEVYDALQAAEDDTQSRVSPRNSYSVPRTASPPYRRIDNNASLASFLSAHSRSPRSSTLDSVYNGAVERDIDNPLKPVQSLHSTGPFRDIPYTRSIV